MTYHEVLHPSEFLCDPTSVLARIAVVESIIDGYARFRGGRGDNSWQAELDSRDPLITRYEDVLDWEGVRLTGRLTEGGALSTVSCGLYRAVEEGGLESPKDTASYFVSLTRGRFSAVRGATNWYWHSEMTDEERVRSVPATNHDLEVISELVWTRQSVSWNKVRPLITRQKGLMRLGLVRPEPED